MYIGYMNIYRAEVLRDVSARDKEIFIRETESRVDFFSLRGIVAAIIFGIVNKIIIYAPHIQ